jgi:uncharacterized protein
MNSDYDKLNRARAKAFPSRDVIRRLTDFWTSWRSNFLPYVPLVIALSMAGWGASCGEIQPAKLGFSNIRTYSDHLETDVGYLSADGTPLAGTLYLPISSGPHPAVVFHFGSPRWTRALYDNSAISDWTNRGIAVLSYDKRGVGLSGGKCCPVNDPNYFPLLGGDVLAGVHTLQRYPDIDPRRVGAFGFSQGGWVVPVAAANAPQDVAFIILGSGPAVTLGEEELFSQLTGDNNCKPTGLSEQEIEDRLQAAGPSGFDPIPYLERMTSPGLWLYGGKDTSIPVNRSIANLERIRTTLKKDFTIIVFPDANHGLVIGGAICQDDGPRPGVSEAMFKWLLPRIGL